MIIALAGRRIDALDAPVARFPLEESAAVRERISHLLKVQRGTDLVVSASCGTDLLALEAAGELGIRRHVVLPFSPEQFRMVSVVDRPGDWGPIFDQIIPEVEATGELLLLHEGSENEENFEEIFTSANTVILDKAQQLAASSSEQSREDAVLAIIVWEGQSRGEGDLTENFANQARARAIPVIEVATL